MLLLILMISCKLGKGQDYLYLTKEYPFITTDYIVSNKIKEIKIFSPDSLLLGYEKYNKYGLVIENCIFENTIITEKNEFYYDKNQLLKSVKSFYSRYFSGFQSFKNFTYEYDNKYKLKYILEIKPYGVDTLCKTYYNDIGQKSFEIKDFNEYKLSYIYENNILIKETLSALFDSSIKNFTNYFYEGNQLIKKEKIMPSINHTVYSNLYIYINNRLTGFNGFTYSYKGNVIVNSKYENNPSYGGYNVIYSYYD